MNFIHSRCKEEHSEYSENSECSEYSEYSERSECSESSEPSLVARSRLDSILREADAYRWGVARCEPVSPDDIGLYTRWTAGGNHAGMSYLEKYGEVRSDPHLLLDGAQSLIVCAFPYYHPVEYSADRPRFARYALATDYHEVVRERLTRAATAIREQWGGETRVCVDTAPLRERYWAVRAGLGFIGRNCQLIIPGAGSYFFIGTILTTVTLEPDAPCTLGCGDCGRCLKACPTGALGAGLENENTGFPILDARRCISYLTIEHRGPLPENPRLGNRIYGCDVCADVCPHNAAPPVTTIPEFIPRQSVTSLTLADITSLTPERFASIFTHSAVKRTKLAGLIRNAAHLG